MHSPQPYRHAHDRLLAPKSAVAAFAPTAAQEVPSASDIKVRKRVKEKQGVESTAEVEPAPPPLCTSVLNQILIPILGAKEFVKDEVWQRSKQILEDTRKANLAAGRDEYEGCLEALGVEVEEL